MTALTQQCFENAIHLPPVERAELVEQLLSSFDFPSRETLDGLWAKEAEDRIDAYDRGEIKGISASQVFARINGNKS